MNIIVFLQLILTPIMPITEMSSLLWLLYFTLFTIKSAIFQGHLLILFSFQAHKKRHKDFIFQIWDLFMIKVIHSHNTEIAK